MMNASDLKNFTNAARQRANRDAVAREDGDYKLQSEIVRVALHSWEALASNAARQGEAYVTITFGHIIGNSRLRSEVIQHFTEKKLNAIWLSGDLLQIGWEV